MRLQSGAEERLQEAAALDPGFALAHAALAMLGHEAGAGVDVTGSLEAAREAARTRADERERSLVDVVGRRVGDVRRSGATALMNHIAQHPRDVLAVSAAVPTIAFSGVTDLQQEAWELVEGLAPAYGDHWWYISLLAFTRQDQWRFDEAGLLAESALSCEPTSGHAVHAQTHVMYETGQHETGRAWLDHWVARAGAPRATGHTSPGTPRCTSWRSVTPRLSGQRYYSELAPPTVTGVRALIDSASLLWRWCVTTSGWDAAAGTAAFAGRVGPAARRRRARGRGRRPRRPTGDAVRGTSLRARGRCGRRPGRLAALRAHCEASGELGPHGRRHRLRRAPRRRRACWGHASRLLTDVLPASPGSVAPPPSARSSRRRCSSASSTTARPSVPCPARRPPRPPSVAARRPPPRLARRPAGGVVRLRGR